MMEEPRCIREGYVYVEPKTGEWRLKKDAPEWATRELEQFSHAVNLEPDDNGIVTAY